MFSLSNYAKTTKHPLKYVPGIHYKIVIIIPYDSLQYLSLLIPLMFGLLADNLIKLHIYIISCKLGYVKFIIGILAITYIN